MSENDIWDWVQMKILYCILYLHAIKKYMWSMCNSYNRNFTFGYRKLYLFLLKEGEYQIWHLVLTEHFYSVGKIFIYNYLSFLTNSHYLNVLILPVSLLFKYFIIAIKMRRDIDSGPCPETFQLNACWYMCWYDCSWNWDYIDFHNDFGPCDCKRSLQCACPRSTPLTKNGQCVTKDTCMGK